MRRAKSFRNNDLAKIHIAKKELGLCEDTYRHMLRSVAGVESAADLDVEGRRKVLQHFSERGYIAKRKNDVPAASPEKSKAALYGKIAALLGHMDLPWAYADGIAKQMFKIEKALWCRPEELTKIVAALEYHKRKYVWND